MHGGSTSGGPPPNVIKYYGSLMQGPRVWIIMEYAEGGSIRTLVRVFVLCTVYHLLLTSQKQKKKKKSLGRNH